MDGRVKCFHGNSGHESRAGIPGSRAKRTSSVHQVRQDPQNPLNSSRRQRQAQRKAQSAELRSRGQITHSVIAAATSSEGADGANEAAQIGSEAGVNPGSSTQFPLTSNRKGFEALANRLIDRDRERLAAEGEARDQSGDTASVSGSRQSYPGKRVTVDPRDYEDYSQAVDALWSMLPVDKLKRPGEAAWDIDDAGPVGAERFDNVYGKVQRTLNLDAIASIGMGTWRLKAYSSSLIQHLVSNIEGAWRHFVDDLGLYGLPRKWSFLDSVDPEQRYGDWSWKDLESPSERDDPKYPRLMIENRCYQSVAFRKLHMEVAVRQDGLEIFHCVMYPRSEFDLPILSIDVVAKDQKISLAIVDPCPVSPDLSLPEAYMQITRELQEIYSVVSNRETPEWGKKIFSSQCVLMNCRDEEDHEAFLSYLIAMVRVHLRLAAATDPIEGPEWAERRQEIERCQSRYCSEQLKNEKTRRVLAAAFSKGFADEYMADVMFDVKSQEPAKVPAEAR